MPFTLSHPLVVIPLRRLGLPLTALAIGAMVPDVVLFLPLPVDYTFTHSLLGLISADLLIGLVLCGLWAAVLRAPLHDAAPSAVRARIPQPPLHVRPPGARTVLLAAAGVVLGGITHVLWDGFTHEHGMVVRHLPVLRASAPLFPVYQWLQYGCSLLGLAGILAIIAVALARRTPLPAPRRSRIGGPLVLVIPGVLAALAAGLILGAGWGHYPLESLVYVLARAVIGVAGLGLAIGCALWWALLAWEAPKLRS